LHAATISAIFAIPLASTAYTFLAPARAAKKDRIPEGTEREREGKCAEQSDEKKKKSRRGNSDLDCQCAEFKKFLTCSSANVEYHAIFEEMLAALYCRQISLGSLL
jgi:hypothetical protein